MGLGIFLKTKRKQGEQDIIDKSGFSSEIIKEFSMLRDIINSQSQSRKIDLKSLVSKAQKNYKDVIKGDDINKKQFVCVMLEFLKTVRDFYLYKVGEVYKIESRVKKLGNNVDKKDYEKLIKDMFILIGEIVDVDEKNKTCRPPLPEPDAKKLKENIEAIIKSINKEFSSLKYKAKNSDDNKKLYDDKEYCVVNGKNLFLVLENFYEKCTNEAYTDWSAYDSVEKKNSSDVGIEEVMSLVGAVKILSEILISLKKGDYKDRIKFVNEVRNKKDGLTELINEANGNGGCLSDSKYTYNENIDTKINTKINTDSDSEIFKVLRNLEEFWLKVAESKCGGTKLLEKEDYIRDQIAVCCSVMECSLKVGVTDLDISIDKIFNELGGYLKEKSTKQKDDKKYRNELLESLKTKFENLVRKFNEIRYKREDDRHSGNNNNFSELEADIKSLLTTDLYFEIEKFGDKRYSNARDRMFEFSDEVSKIFGEENDIKKRAKIEKKLDIGKIQELSELINQELSVVGRLTLYVEKINALKRAGALGKLAGKLGIKRKYKKEALKLKKCFEDMAKYIIKHTNTKDIDLLDFKKLVKCKKLYRTWNENLIKVLSNSNLTTVANKYGNIENLLMSILFLSLVDLDGGEDIIAACDGLKDGGMRSGEAQTFEGKVTIIRKAIKGKCVALDKGALKTDIQSLCVKYLGISPYDARSIGKWFLKKSNSGSQK